MRKVSALMVILGVLFSVGIMPAIPSFKNEPPVRPVDRSIIQDGIYGAGTFGALGRPPAFFTDKPPHAGAISIHDIKGTVTTRNPGLEDAIKEFIDKRDCGGGDVGS